MYSGGGHGKRVARERRDSARKHLGRECVIRSNVEIGDGDLTASNSRGCDGHVNGEEAGGRGEADRATNDRAAPLGGGVRMWEAEVS